MNFKFNNNDIYIFEDIIDKPFVKEGHWTPNATQEDLIEAKKQLEEFPKDNYFQKKYERINDWYNRVYNKEDLISYLKTEELFNLMYRIIEHVPNIEILNEVNMQGNSLILKIK